MPQIGNTNLARFRALVVLATGTSGLPGALSYTFMKWSVLLSGRSSQLPAMMRTGKQRMRSSTPVGIFPRSVSLKEWA
jgi:hypothetical protein